MRHPIHYSRRLSSRRLGLPALAVPALIAAAATSATANTHAMQTSNFLDRPHLQDTIQSYASGNVDIDEMAMSPDGNWIVVAGGAIEHSPGFDGSCLAKIHEYVNAGLEIDVIAFAPNGAWMVIAEHLAWHSTGLSYVDTLEQKIVERINAGQRITELAFDADGSGWTLISGNWAFSVSIPSDLYAAIVERHKSKRMIEQVEFSPDGRWLLLADDWYASSGLVSSCVSWLKSFQRNEWSLDRIMLGLGGNWVLFSNGVYVPNMSIGMEAIEYGMDENLWQKMADANVVGLSIAVIEDYELKWARTYGEIEGGTQRWLRADTPMDAASLSKPLAAMTLSSMIEDGVFSLDTTVYGAAIWSYYKFGFPYWSPLLLWAIYGSAFQNGLQLPANQITLRQLLSHSASLEPWGTTSYLPGDALPNTLQMLFGHDSTGSSESYGGGNMPWYDPFILGDGVMYQPGDVWRYSGGGFMVAQAMAESLTLADFEATAKSRVFDVLDMDDSTYYQPLSGSYADRAAVPHDSSGAPVPEDQRPIYPWAAGGGLYTTPTDLTKAIIALMQQGIGPNGAQVLEASSVAEMLTEQAAGGVNYGLGISLSANAVTPNNDQWFGHNGGHTYANAILAGNPGKGEGVAFLISSGSQASEDFRDELWEHFKSVYAWE